MATAVATEQLACILTYRKFNKTRNGGEDYHLIDNEVIYISSEYSSLSSFNPTRTKLILNADGVYITSYSALHLNMKLASMKAYSVEKESELLQRKAITSR